MSITVKNISYHYDNPGSEHSGRQVLCDISVSFDRDSFTAVIGPTGSGKSTFIQHLNLLLRADQGDILYDGESIYAQGYDRKKLRSRVGLVFQYPEYQLFETDVLSDVSFGPKNLGLPEDEVRKRASQALLQVGFSEADFHRSPFELSGGQKRRAAIAGVLAMQPEYLILDEPAAGLDPAGRRELFDMLGELHKKGGVGIILVSHSMDDVAKYADRLIVLNEGRILYDATPAEVFSHGKELESIGLDVPQAAKAAQMLRNRGILLPEGLITMEQVKTAILDHFG